MMDNSQCKYSWIKLLEIEYLLKEKGIVKEKTQKILKNKEWNKILDKKERKKERKQWIAEI